MTVLLDADADIHAQTDEGNTPLHWAAEHGQPEAITALLDRGADPQIKNNDGDRPVDATAPERIGQELYSQLQGKG